MQTRPIRFYFRGDVVSVDGVAPTLTVLDWLREHARATGTKEGCGEGDCGACTVVIGELADGALKLRSVNACIQFMPMLDGRALFTVEDLKTIAGGVLHPVQQALVDRHASQCGFCTPGFAMSLFGVYEQHQAAGTRATRQGLADALSGNLCRCTGYRPILDAGEHMFDAAPVRLDAAPIVTALRDLATQPSLVYAGPHRAQAGTAQARSDRFYAPRSLSEFARLRAELPDARLLAGATDIGLWVNKQMRDVGDLLYIGAVAELRRIDRSDAGLRIGAAATLEDAWAALVDWVPALSEIALRFAAPPVRHAGTLGGNIANGSPIGDGAPVLMALDAQLLLRQGEAERRIALDDFYVDYMRNRLARGEFIAAIEVPRPNAATRLRAYKISKRYDCDISAVCAGLAVTLDEGVVTQARFAYGGMAAIVKRAAHAERAVIGQPWSEASVHAAMAALAADFSPLSDMRARADHRLRTARNLLLRLWLETRLDDALDASRTRVWATPAFTSEATR